MKKLLLILPLLALCLPAQVQLNNARLSNFQATSTGGGGGFSDITNGLALWYKLNGNVLDSSGNGLDGSVSGGPSYGNGVNGVANTALVLNGSSQFASSPNTNFPGAVTISIWVNFSSLANAYNCLAYKSATPAFSLYTTTAGKVAIYNTGAASYDGSGSHTLATGQWYMITFTQATGNGLVGYVNGELDKSTSGNDIVDSTQTVLYIGEDSGSSGRRVDGAICGVRVYNRVLNTSEIITLYTNGISGSIF